MTKVRAERIKKVDDGSRVKIEVYAEMQGSEFVYTVVITKCAPRKRTWVPLYDIRSYEYIQMSRDERDSFRVQKREELVTNAEIFEVCDKVHLRLVPVLANLNMRSY